MKEPRNRLDEAFATFGGAVRLMLIYGSPFWILGVISLGRIYSGGPFEHFALGDVLMPRFLDPGATNLGVFILCGIGLTFVAVAIVWRYFYHRRLIRYLRERGVQDLDGDGKTDSFADKFLDDL